VIIHGAGGAVGSMAVQLARWAGAEVIGTGRDHSRALATGLGADRYIALDNGSGPLQDVAGQADLVFDTIGAEVLTGSAALLRPGERWSRSRPTRCCPLTGTTSARWSSSRNPAALSWPSWPAWSTKATCARRSARCTRWPRQSRRSARRPPAGSPAGSSSSRNAGV